MAANRNQKWPGIQPIAVTTQNPTAQADTPNPPMATPTTKKAQTAWMQNHIRAKTIGLSDRRMAQAEQQPVKMQSAARETPTLNQLAPPSGFTALMSCVQPTNQMARLSVIATMTKRAMVVARFLFIRSLTPSPPDTAASPPPSAACRARPPLSPPRPTCPHTGTRCRRSG